MQYFDLKLKRWNIDVLCLVYDLRSVNKHSENALFLVVIQILNLFFALFFSSVHSTHPCTYQVSFSFPAWEHRCCFPWYVRFTSKLYKDSPRFMMSNYFVEISLLFEYHNIVNLESFMSIQHLLNKDILHFYAYSRRRDWRNRQDNGKSWRGKFPCEFKMN